MANPTLYRSTIGALQYLTYTRSDIVFVINKLGHYLQQPTELHWTAWKKVLRYLKGIVHHRLHFTPTSSLHVQEYINADWASYIDDRCSIIGYCVFLGTNILTWSFHKQFVVARSSTEVEYRAFAHASTEVAWLHSLFSKFLLLTHLSYGVIIKALGHWLLTQCFILEWSILKWMCIMFMSKR